MIYVTALCDPQAAGRCSTTHVSLSQQVPGALVGRDFLAVAAPDSGAVVDVEYAPQVLFRMLLALRSGRADPPAEIVLQPAVDHGRRRDVVGRAAFVGDVDEKRRSRAPSPAPRSGSISG